MGGRFCGVAQRSNITAASMPCRGGKAEFMDARTLIAQWAAN